MVIKVEEQGEKCVETISGPVENNTVLPDILEALLKISQYSLQFKNGVATLLILEKKCKFEVCL